MPYLLVLAGRALAILLHLAMISPGPRIGLNL